MKRNVLREWLTAASPRDKRRAANRAGVSVPQLHNAAVKIDSGGLGIKLAVKIERVTGIDRTATCGECRKCHHVKGGK